MRGQLCGIQLRHFSQLWNPSLMQLRPVNFLGFIPSRFSVWLVAEYCRDTRCSRANASTGDFY